MHTYLWPEARAALGKAVLLASLWRPSSLSFLLIWATVWCGGTPQSEPDAQLGNHCSTPLAAFFSALFPLWFWSAHLGYTTSAEEFEIVSLEKKPFSDPPLWVDLGSHLLGCVWARVMSPGPLPVCLPYSSGDPTSGPLCVVMKGRVVIRPRAVGTASFSEPLHCLGVLEKFRTSLKVLWTKGLHMSE